MFFSIKSQKGFGLIEVLIALSIFAFGFLAVELLQLSAFAASQNALNRTSAGLIAQDLVNRIQQNRVEAVKGVSSYYNDPNGTKGATSINNECFDITRNCTPVELAQTDLFQVYANVREFLPQGSTLRVCIDSTTTGSCNGALTNGAPVYSIIVRWPITTAHATFGQIQYPDIGLVRRVRP